MKRPLHVLCLRVLAVISSATLLGAYAWFSQRKAQSMTPPVSPAGVQQVGGDAELTVMDPQGKPTTIMLGSKSPVQPVFAVRQEREAAAKGAVIPLGQTTSAEKGPSSNWIMSGSKSFTGASVIVSGQLLSTGQSQPPAPAAANPPPKPVMPGSKRIGAVVTPESIDELLNEAGMGSKSARSVVMPGSKISRVFFKDGPPPPLTAAAPARSKPLEHLHGTLGKQSSKPDKKGTLQVTQPSHSDLGAYGLPKVIPPHAVLPPLAPSPSHTVLPESKYGPVAVLPAPAPAWEKTVTMAAGTPGEDLWPASLRPRWSIREALEDIQRHLRLGAGASLPQARMPSVMSSSKSGLLIPSTPTKPVPSVIAMPESSATPSAP